MAKIPSQNIL